MPANESAAQIDFPFGGIDLSHAFARQPMHTTLQGEQVASTPVGTNVRAFDVLQARQRGGQRPGLSKYIAGQANGSNVIQELNTIVSTGINAPGSAGTIRVVQNVANAGNLGTTISTAFPATVATGNTIVVVLHDADTNTTNAVLPTSCTDSVGNVYTLAVSKTGVGSGNAISGGGGTKTAIAVYYSANVIGGSITVTGTFPSSASAGMGILEISGLQPNPLGPVSSNNDGGSTQTSANPGTITTTSSSSIVLACIQSIIGIDEHQEVVPLGGYTSIAYYVGSRPASDQYQVFSTIQSSLSPSWTFAQIAPDAPGPQTAQGYSAVMASFNAAPVVSQTTQSGRVVTLVAVSQGQVRVVPSGAAAWVTPANTTGKNLITSGIVRSAPNNQNLYFADGVNWLLYSPAANAVLNWTATQGVLPTDVAGNAPRLIALYRGRTVLSGLLEDSQNWFMSAVGDPTNWNYFPDIIVATQAVAGNNSTLGKVGDPITCLISYTDDVLIFGCDSSIWQLQGDPMSGGQIDLVSSTIGMAWGNPWCKGPDGTLYFLSNKLGVYQMMPGQGPPTRMSQPIEQLLVAINTGTSIVRFLWDDQWQGFHIFVTNVAAQAATTHFFYEWRTGAWWEDTYGSTAYNPLAVCTFDGNTPGDRRDLIGGWDGYVRALSPTATTDDGTAIASSVVLGPLVTKDMQDTIWKDLQAALGVGSGPVSYAIYVGPTAEIALSSTAVATGTWSVAGRNPTNFIRRAGHAIWLSLSATTPWALEQVRAIAAGKGRIRQRRAY